ncbi:MULTISPECIES: hypothetical protein [unclassified Pseudovibrio]|uniref:hypothetical protein n=1 Tax=unclassified Pseudovibrio TaxID=2627060 RepID=UPI0007AEA599|nr:MULTISPECIES: hypothetical protein [unclassified Pseudovibrio]KZL02813.1 hypothetical protein PsW74_01007 [Pseudovibrio sp. W74]KZL07516.1 hypothetical protein PsAD14_03902 [Pseudovibrio sp. Ad14]
MNSIDNDVFSDRCNVPLFLLSEAAKLAVLVAFAITLLLLAPALDETVIEAKQSIPSDFISTQLSSFDADKPLK